MAQMKVVTWTNPGTAVARNESVGFQVNEVFTTDVTNGGSWYWNSSMGSGYYQTISSGAITTSNGVTPLSQSGVFGAAITAFTNANPGVITASNIAQVGIVAGDTIAVTDVADDQSAATSLNGTYTVASVTATAITLDQNTTSYSVYVSGGTVVRVSDSNGDPIPTENKAIQGVTLGTGVVGGNSAVMTAVFKGENPVV